VVTEDVFGEFAKGALASHLRSLYLVTPWADDSARALPALVRRVRDTGARVVLVTRAQASAAHAAAIKSVRELPRGSVIVNDRLHAKLYICEARDGSGLAVVGSANMTLASTSMAEAAIMVRGRGRDPIIRDLVAAAAALARGSRAIQSQSTAHGAERWRRAR